MGAYYGTQAHDPHVRPPETLRLLFKRWQKVKDNEFDAAKDLIDTAQIYEGTEGLIPIAFHAADTHQGAVRHFLSAEGVAEVHEPFRFCFEAQALPGLFVYPCLYSHDVQRILLDKTLHRDTSLPQHTNNLHLYYDLNPLSQFSRSSENAVERYESFFALPKSTQILPRDPAIHKPLTIDQVLGRKLRWVTFGGQYDWTQKRYPDEQPPEFPTDVSDLLRGAFPTVDPQAAILNLYSPGDTLSIHRDVSEFCDRGLVSVSVGCDCIFVVGSQDGSRNVVLRLHSGDALLMSGESRFAWHGVPKVIAGTCPQILKDWPATENGNYGGYKGWLNSKRINLNVRQMQAAPFYSNSS